MTRMITVVPREDNFLYSQFEVPTKHSLESRMANYGITSFGGKRGQSYSGRVKDGFIFLYTAQKYRRKTQTIPLTKKHQVKNGANASKFKTEVLRRNHWKVRVYKFPLDRVIEAKQLARTFKISITQ